MTPNEILHLCGFRRTGRRDHETVQYVYKPPGMSPEVRRTDLRVDVVGSDGGETAYRATVSMKSRTLIFDTVDIRDVAAIGVAYRNWLEAPHVVARDPARSMPIPGGLVSMPFHSGDGSWVAGVGADGFEHVRNPVARWGSHYEAHREAWYRACVGTPLQAAPEAYLRAAGFVPRDGAFRLTSYPAQARPGATEAARLRPLVFDLFAVENAEGAPFFVVECSDTLGAGGTPRLGCADVRDVLAFVVAAENWIFDETGPQALSHERALDLPGNGVDVRNPFGHPGDDRSWRGWFDAVTLQLAHPSEVHGHSYIQWRDRWAADVLAHGAPVPCSRSSDNLNTDVPAMASDRVRLAGTTSGVCTFEGGDEQIVAVFETDDPDSPILMGRGVLRTRIDALTAVEQALSAAEMPLAETPAAGWELEAWDAIADHELRLAPMPAFR